MPAQAMAHNPDDALPMSDEMHSLLDLLEDLCNNEGVEAKHVINSFEQAGIQKRISLTFKRKGLSVCDEVLYRRLRESVEKALLAGPKRCWQEPFVDEVEDALEKAKGGKDMDANKCIIKNLDFAECDSLVYHLKALQAAHRGKVMEMLDFLKNMTRKDLKKELSENVAAIVLRSLCGEIEKENAQSTSIDRNAAILLFNNITEILTTILLGPENSKSEHDDGLRKPVLSRYHIEVQVFGIRLAGLLALAIANFEENKSNVSKTMNALLAPTASRGLANTVPNSKYWKQSKQATDLIKTLLDSRSAHNEHASVWACLKTLKFCCTNKTLCERFLLGGLLTQLEDMKIRIQNMEYLGDPIYFKVEVGNISKSKPDFIAPASIRVNEEEKVDEEMISQTSARAKYTLARDAIKNTDFDPRNAKLLYLLGQDEFIAKDDFKRCCDRNFLLLLIKDVQMTFEKTRKRLAGTFGK